MSHYGIYEESFWYTDKYTEILGEHVSRLLDEKGMYPSNDEELKKAIEFKKEVDKVNQEFEDHYQKALDAIYLHNNNLEELNHEIKLIEKIQPTEYIDEENFTFEDTKKDLLSLTAGLGSLTPMNKIRNNLSNEQDEEMIKTNRNYLIEHEENEGMIDDSMENKNLF